MMTKNGGFNLIELMMVISILSILSSLAIHSSSGYIAKARTSEAKVHLGALLTGLQAFHIDHRSYTECLAQIGAGSTPIPGTNYSLGFHKEDPSIQSCGLTHLQFCNCPRYDGTGAVPSCAGGAQCQWGTSQKSLRASATSANQSFGPTINIDWFGIALPLLGEAHVYDSNSFTAAAIGRIDGNQTDDSVFDVWTIDQGGQLRHVVRGY